MVSIQVRRITDYPNASDVGRPRDHHTESISPPLLHYPQGERQPSEYIFSVYDSDGECYVIHIIPEVMMKFHLYCFEQLCAGPLSIEEDLIEELRSFLSACETQKRLSPELLRKLEQLVR